MNIPPVLWSDTHLLVVDKPSGLATLPDGWEPDMPFLRGLLEADFGRLWVVHRLDRETSGVIILARSAQAHRALNLQFEQRQVSKIYHALLLGDPAWDTQNLAMPLRVNVGRGHRTVIDHRNGKNSLTDINILKRLGMFALVEALPHTGRTHQIRAHLAAVGHPIAGDPLYGYNEKATRKTSGKRPTLVSADTITFTRTMLHAISISFLHPLTGQLLRVDAPYPPDFLENMEKVLATLH